MGGFAFFYKPRFYKTFCENSHAVEVARDGKRSDACHCIMSSSQETLQRVQQYVQKRGETWGFAAVSTSASRSRTAHRTRLSENEHASHTHLIRVCRKYSGLISKRKSSPEGATVALRPRRVHLVRIPEGRLRGRDGQCMSLTILPAYRRGCYDCSPTPNWRHRCG